MFVFVYLCVHRPAVTLTAVLMAGYGQSAGGRWWKMVKQGRRPLSDPTERKY